MLDQVEGLSDILAAQTVANAADAVSVELWSQVIDPTRDYFSEFMLPPHLPTNMSKLGVQSQSVVESGNLIPHSGRPYGTDTSRQRQDHSRRPSCDTAIEGFDQRARRTLRPQPESGHQDKLGVSYDPAERRPVPWQTTP